MMLAVLGLSGHAGVITQHISMPEESPTLSIVEEDGEEFTVVDWADLDRESEPGRLALPVTTLTLRVPTYSRDFTVSTSNVSWREPLILEHPIGVVSEKTSSASTIMSEEIKEKLTKANTIPFLSVEVINEYFLNWTEHYVMIKVNCVFTAHPTNIVPLRSVDIELGYQECEEDELAFDIKAMTLNSTTKHNDSSRAISLNPSAPLDKYLIITTKNLVEACRNIALWKTQKGLDVGIFAIEDILSMPAFRIGYNGILDEAYALRCFLQAECNPSVNNYCLFIGPSERIPLRYFYNLEAANRTHENDNKLNDKNFIPSDIYYSDLVKNWNVVADPVGKYAIPVSNITYSPNIFVGRLVCHYPDEIANYLHKLIYYEAYPGKGDDEYLGRGLVTKQTQHLEYNDLPSLLGTLTNVTRLLDNKGLTFETTLPQGRDVIMAMKQVGLMSLQGHGMPTSIACGGPTGDKYVHRWRYIKFMNDFPASTIGYGGYNTPEEPNSGLDLLDNIFKPSVLYSMSCNVMPFDQFARYDQPYNMGTSFTVAGLYGGVAFLGNTRTGWDYDNIHLESQFASEIKAYPHIGKGYSFAKAKADMGGYARAAHNLMGDPEFCMWFHKPYVQSMDIKVQPFSIQATGASVAGSTIVLYDGVNPPVKFVPTSSSYYSPLPTSGFDNGFFSTSVWQPGTLPYINMTAQNTVLNNATKNFIVNDAIFGSSVNPAREEGECVINQNAVLNITALKSISITEGFHMAANSQAEFRSLSAVEINGGIVEGSSTFNINGESVEIFGGFNVTQGAELKINHSPYVLNPFTYETN